MSTAIRKSVRVQAEGVIEVRSPQLHAGTRADVIVILDDEEQAPHRPLASYVGSCKGTFKTAEEVDEFIRRERDSWE